MSESSFCMNSSILKLLCFYFVSKERQEGKNLIGALSLPYHKYPNSLWYRTNSGTMGWWEEADSSIPAKTDCSIWELQKPQCLPPCHVHARMLDSARALCVTKVSLCWLFTKQCSFTLGHDKPSVASITLWLGAERRSDPPGATLSLHLSTAAHWVT